MGGAFTSSHQFNTYDALLFIATSADAMKKTRKLMQETLDNEHAKSNRQMLLLACRHWLGCEQTPPEEHFKDVLNMFPMSAYCIDQYRRWEKELVAVGAANPAPVAIRYEKIPVCDAFPGTLPILRSLLSLFMFRLDMNQATGKLIAFVSAEKKRLGITTPTAAPAATQEEEEEEENHGKKCALM